MTFVDTTVVQGNTYTYRVGVVTPGGTVYSTTVTILVDIPPAPSNLQAFPFRLGTRQRVVLVWLDNSNNESSFTVQWSTNPTFATGANSANVAADTPVYITGLIARQPWYFRVRANNALGSSAWVTTAQILPANVVANNGLLAPQVFANGFAAGLAGWTGQVGNVQAVAAAAMGGVAGQGLAANMTPAAQAFTAGTQSAYVFDQTPEGLGHYLANFFFDPNDATTGDEPVDIFVGLDAESEPIFGIQFLHTAEAPTVYRIRAWAKVAEDEIYGAWAPIANGPQNIQLDWDANQHASVFLYVDGEHAATMNVDTSGYLVDEVRLGPSRGTETSDTTASIASGTLYFDEFMSFGSVANTQTLIFMPMIAGN